MKKWFTTVLTLVLVLSALTAALCGCAGGKTESTSSSITVGIANDIDSLDPNKTVTAGTREVLFNIYEGLVKPDSSGNLNPAVAESYTISDDARVYTFTLRDGVKFHNGAKVTAEDVVFSINRCADASSGNQLAPAFDSIESVEAVDDKTVVITLKEGDSEFLPYLTTAIVPKNNDDYENHPAGTGPYMFVSRSPQENVVLKKFADYWDPDGTKGGTPAHIDNVTLKIISNPDMLVMNLEGGSVDMIFHLSASQAAQLDESKFTVTEGTMNLVQALYLNNAVPELAVPEVRKALCYALDRTEVFDAVSNGKGTPVGSAMYPAYGKYYLPELNDAYPTNLDKAKELLAEAGYPDGFDLEITVPANYRQHVDTAQVLSEQFKRIGVNVTIRQVEWESWVSDVYQGRSYVSTVVGVDANTLNAPAMLSRYVSTASKNFVNFQSSEFDETYALAVGSTDDAEKTEAYKKCLTILSDEAASVYIQDLPDLVGMSNKFTGYTFYPLYVVDLAAIRPAE